MSSQNPVSQQSALYHQYAQILPYKVARLCALISLLRSDDADIAVLCRALQEVHQLKGAAGEHGFVQVSRYAGLVERALASATPEVNWEDISHLLDHLMAIAKSQSEHSLAMSGAAETGECR
jgi:HPt (histidine-containing phosphotransfer) domain-containing protein